MHNAFLLPSRRSTTLAAAILLFASLTAEAQFTPSVDFSKRVFTSFKQGAANNCASIAVIKASIATFGMDLTNGIFKEDQVSLEDGLHHITLRSGEVLTISTAQINQAKDYSKFEMVAGAAPESQIVDRAYLLYAVMAQRAATLGTQPGSIFSEASSSYEDGLRLLSLEGRDADLLPALFGLKTVDVPTTSTDQIAYIQTNYYHAAFAVQGMYDEHGTPTPTVRLDSLHSACFLHICLHKGQLDAFYLQSPPQALTASD
jgi:hypothetical protein